MKIDLHTHHYPESYLNLLRERGIVEFKRGEEGREIMVDKGARIVTLVNEMTDISSRISEMDRVGIDMQVLSLTTPNVYFDDLTLAQELTRASNENLSEICSQYPERFLSFASVPLNHPQAAVDEMIYAINHLQMNGLVIGTNVQGKLLDDDLFDDFFSSAAEKKIPILLHPMSPWGKEKMGDLGLAPLIGFVFDTTLTVSRMVFKGVFERIPNLKLILPHAGGTIPFLWERLNNGWRAYPESRKHCPKVPEEYLKALFYDVVSFHKPALQCLIDTVGTSQIVLGSDYPHVIGDLERSVKDIDSLNIDSVDKEKILFLNASNLLINLHNSPLDGKGSLL